MRYSKKTFPLISLTCVLLMFVVIAFSGIMTKNKKARIIKIPLLTDEKNHIYKLRDTNVSEKFDEKLCKGKFMKKFEKHSGDEVLRFMETSCQACNQKDCQYHLAINQGNSYLFNTPNDVISKLGLSAEKPNQISFSEPIKTFSPSLFAGRLHVDTEYMSMEELLKDERYENIQNGGWYTPTNCRPIKSVAIIVPFRNRENHLTIFLRHMHPILQRQNLHYRIFVVDQVDREKFNRGKLFNVGFIESQKFFPYDCVVFHDVDLLSEDDRNTFDCSTSPQHMCAFLDKFNYRLIYDALFGGVEMFSKEDFETVNGFSNSYWGWGAEDDDLFNRLEWKNLTLWRTTPGKSRYRMIKHKDAEAGDVDDRRSFRAEAMKHFATDGLVNLQYEILNVHIEKLYTRIQVNLRKERDKMFGVKEFPP